MRTLLICAVALTLGPTAEAQSSNTNASRTTGLRAFAIEATGGTLGASLGYGAAYLAARQCDDVEDTVRCALAPAAGAIVAGTALSATGAVLFGKARNTEPSVAGAIVGSIAGAAAGIGIDHVLREEMNAHHSRALTIATVAVTQGIVTAVGSRIVSSMKRR